MSKRRWHCVDCGVDTIKAEHYYMVRDDIWAASGLGPHDGMLCCGCLEQRIGRQLEYEDFTCVWPRRSQLTLPLKGGKTGRL